MHVDVARWDSMVHDTYLCEMRVYPGCCENLGFKLKPWLQVERHFNFVLDFTGISLHARPNSCLRKAQEIIKGKISNV